MLLFILWINLHISLIKLFVRYIWMVLFQELILLIFVSKYLVLQTSGRFVMLYKLHLRFYFIYVMFVLIITNLQIGSNSFFITIFWRKRLIFNFVFVLNWTQRNWFYLSIFPGRINALWSHLFLLFVFLCTLWYQIFTTPRGVETL